MPKALPSLKPSPRVLQLCLADEALCFGAKKLSLPPKNLEEISILHHAGVRQAVYVGTHVFARFLKDRQNHNHDDNFLPIALLYRHILDIGDSIATLVRFDSVSSAAILLRALFESVLSLRFLLEGNKFHNDRADCYWTSIKIKELEVATKGDPTTVEGKSILQKVLPHVLSSPATLQSYTEQRKQLEAELDGESYREYWERYKKAKKEKRPRAWYALCSKANSLRDLAKLTGMEREYLMFYASLSEIAHAEDVITDLLHVKSLEQSVEVSVEKMRGPAGKVGRVAAITIIFLLQTHETVQATYLTEDKKFTQMYRQWNRSYEHYYRWALSQDWKSHKKPF